jgi:hypothetical protein
MSVVSSATVAVRDRVPLVFWSTSTMVNPEHETGFAEIISSKPTSGQRRCESARGHNFRLAPNPGSVSPMGTTSGASVPTVQEL